MRKAWASGRYLAVRRCAPASAPINRLPNNRRTNPLFHRMMMTTRDHIVACARTFLDVRFAHQGRSAAEGLDCLGLLIATAEKAGCRLQGMRPSALDQREYGSRPDTGYLQTMLAA